MSNLMHKIRDAITGHHSNASSRQHSPNPSAEDSIPGSAGRYESGSGSYGSGYSPGDYERRTDTYGSSAGGSNDSMGNTGSGDYGPGTKRHSVSETGERARQSFGGAEGGISYNARREDTEDYAYSPTNRLDSGKMGSHMMGPDNVRFAGTQRNHW
ncbi:uncharacterized protein BO80DRAFT_95937 [Aspergillus ibericus CBS 121593]|uniref:Uncharacterized protein n=1 Tax=Aspergillus ibericus CBS 121593 TaxID=1448316 RepID=A0A395GYP0_9EURO|nr:hypothetical protein BO80DRAFT_95937 [Aspergillus ibericus CBS 121593]RAL00711.1 hypothetical protein BO80DRAFT_95937 [Aspergillus ibericus CBS 121593]